MSFDLMVFEWGNAQRSKREFDRWFETMTDWDLSRSYNSPEGMTPKLRAWFDEARVKFPPMNGPFALSDVDFDALGKDSEARVTDYSIGAEMVYAAFAWSAAEEAELYLRESARRHGLGFYNPQTDTVIYPGGDRKFRLRTDSRDVEEPTMDDIQNALAALSGDEAKFMTLELDNGFMQMIYLPDGTGLYRVEAQPPGLVNLGMPKYYTDISRLGEAGNLLKFWFDTGTMPDFTDWLTYSDTPPEAAPTNAMMNTIVLILAVAAVVIVTVGIAYMVKAFLA
ncbi:MAG: hypothetical protein LBT44_05615 [Clostridiales bacterium]|jgi:hypothetical protein|nr:hypothetical protein [Clostridiales bacterium]